MSKRDSASIPKFQRDIIRIGVSKARGSVAAFILVTGIASLCTVAAPLLIASVVDTPTIDTSALLWAFGLFAAALALARFLQDARMVLMNRVQQSVANQANAEVMRKVLFADASLVTNNNPARIANIIQTFNQSNKMYVQMFLMVFVSCIFDVILAFVVIGGYVNWTIGWAVMLYGAITTWLTLRANKIANKYLKLAQRRANEAANLTGNVVNNALALKVFRGADWILDINRKIFQESRQGWNDFYARRVKFGALQGLLLFAQYAVVFAILAAQNGDGRQHLGAVVVLVLVLAQLNRPFEMIATSLRDFTIARSMAEPLHDTLAAHAPPPPRSGSIETVPDGEMHVELRDVEFRYPDTDVPVLAGLSATFNPGAMNFIVGPSGAGKSTLMRLLLGIHSNYEGSISISGTELGRIPLEAYWEEIGYVPQDLMLMNSSVRDNITMGREFTDTQVEEVLAAVELTDKVATLEGRLDFVIGERGERLSGGERQRIAIARALIARPRLLLLDEASSALDEDTERSIYRTLRNRLTHTTVIAITHRHGVIEKDDTSLELRRLARDLSIA